MDQDGQGGSGQIRDRSGHIKTDQGGSGQIPKTKIGNTYSDSLISNQGTPQGAVLSDMIFSLYTNDLKPETSIDQSKITLKYVDDTSVISLFNNE